eukprot:scaffold8365_cov267-Pinguiococcus_pyrenoidosus.AAC.8
MPGPKHPSADRLASSRSWAAQWTSSSPAPRPASQRRAAARPPGTHGDTRSSRSWRREGRGTPRQLPDAFPISREVRPSGRGSYACPPLCVAPPPGGAGRPRSFRLRTRLGCETAPALSPQIVSWRRHWIPSPSQDSCRSHALPCRTGRPADSRLRMKSNASCCSISRSKSSAGFR